MKESILQNKIILAVDDELDVLTVLEEEILEAAPNCHFFKATTYEEALELIASFTYDLFILDIMGVRGYDLLKLAVNQPSPVPVVMFTAHVLTSEALKRSIEMGARAYLPKEKLGQIVSFLEDVMGYEYGPGWRRLLNQLEGFYNSHWGPYWQKLEEKFWKEFEKKTAGKVNYGSYSNVSRGTRKKKAGDSMVPSILEPEGPLKESPERTVGHLKDLQG